MVEDAALIKQIQRGNESAMEELVLRYYDEIFHYIYRLKGSTEEAKDLTQEVFIAMMKAIPTYKERGYFKAWLYRIAHNRCMNSFRNELIPIEDVDIHLKNSSQSDFTDEFTQHTYVQELLNTLPDKQKNALILKYYHGFTSTEIATITGVSIPTIKSRMFQGLRKLKKEVKGGRNPW